MTFSVKLFMANVLEQLKTSIQSPVANVFDVDQRTGFMVPQPPLSRLPEKWEVWEAALDTAIEARLQLGDKVGLTEAEAAASEQWRYSVRKVRNPTEFRSPDRIQPRIFDL